MKSKQADHRSHKATLLEEMGYLKSARKLMLTKLEITRERMHIMEE